jgi:hypothetical protein
MGTLMPNESFRRRQRRDLTVEIAVCLIVLAVLAALAAIVL